MTTSYKYIFSFVLTNNNISLDSSQHAEYAVTFLNTVMQRGNGIRIIKLTDYLGNEIFIKLTDFGHHDSWVQFYKNDVDRKTFVFRPVYRINAFAEKPILIRMYMLNNQDVIDRLDTLIFLHIEQALMELIEHYKNEIIIESSSQLQLTQNYLSSFSSNVKNTSCLKFQIPLLRTISPEQRNDCQKLLEILQYGIAKIKYSESIPLINDYAIDLNMQTINKKYERPVKHSYLRGSVVHGIMGCGRKRMYTCMFDQIAAGNLEKLQLYDNNKYYADKVSLVVCDTNSIKKWKEELVSTEHIVLSCKSDFDNLTYSFLEKGGVILLDSNGLQHSFEVLEEQIKLLRTIIRFDYNEEFNQYKSDLDMNMIVKYHTQNLCKRLTNAKVPLQWIHFRTVLIDDVLDMNEFDTSKADYYFGRLHRLPESGIISDIGCLTWDWAFVHVKTTGYLPSHLPKDWINALFPILSDPQDELYDKPAMFWREFHLSNGLQTIQTPVSILRKVNLITVPIEITDTENEIFTKIKDLCKQINLRSLFSEEIALSLIGMNIHGIDGLNLPMSFAKQCGVWTKEMAKTIAEDYFEKADGTTAERIYKLMHSDGALSDRKFFFSSLEKNDSCLICYEPRNGITLCGHTFCNECKKTLTDGSQSAVIQCPACRAKLCDYDWIQLGETTKTTDFVLSKIKVLKLKIEQISSRKRPKKTSSSVPSSSVMILCPNGSKKKLKSMIGDFEFIEFSEFIKTFKKQNIPSEVSAIIMVSPCYNSELYQMIVKSTQRISPLQIYLLYANNIESPKIALDTLVNPLSISRSGTRRQRTE